LRSRVLAAVALIVLVAGLTPPAGAQMALTHTFTLRYWGSTLDFSNPNTAVTFSYSHPGWGFSYRGDAQTQPWSLSFNYDRLNNTGTFWETASLWNANLHYRFGNVPNTRLSVFAGYGSVHLSNTAGGEEGTGSGFRLGADVRFDLQSQQMTGWYVLGEAAWGPGWSSSVPAFPGLASGNSNEYKIALGKEFPNGFAAQVGWRAFTWNIPTSPGCLDPGCRWRWSGWTLELLMHR
jgi:hypothetical protein